jgi:autoinducer 2-degrading protein
VFIACVKVWVKPENRDVFIVATLENASSTREEPKNLRFDVLQQIDNPNNFFLYEVYTDESGMIDHKGTTHYKKWAVTVEGMMVKSREGIKYNNLYPEYEEAFKAK